MRLKLHFLLIPLFVTFLLNSTGCQKEPVKLNIPAAPCDYAAGIKGTYTIGVHKWIRQNSIYTYSVNYIDTIVVDCPNYPNEFEYKSISSHSTNANTVILPTGLMTTYPGCKAKLVDIPSNVNVDYGIGNDTIWYLNALSSHTYSHYDYEFGKRIHP